MKLGRQACRIDLLAESPCPLEFRDIDVIRFSIAALRDKFIEIAASEGFSAKDFREAILEYEFPPFMDDYSNNCRVNIVSNSGYAQTKAVDYIGNSAETPNKTDAGNGSNGICRVIDASRSSSPDPTR